MVRQFRISTLVVAIITAFGISACDNGPDYKNMSGEWKFTFPDKKVSVTFRIEGSQTVNYHIGNTTVEYGGLTQTSTGWDDKKAPCSTTRFGDDVLVGFDFLYFDSSTGIHYHIYFIGPQPNEDFTTISLTDAYYMLSTDGSEVTGSPQGVPATIHRK